MKFFNTEKHLQEIRRNITTQAYIKENLEGKYQTCQIISKKYSHLLMDYKFWSEYSSKKCLL